MAKKTFKPEDILNVTNRSSHSVSYPVPESDNKRWRDFAPNETKKITYGEIEAAVQQPGCNLLFYRYLLITDSDAAEEVMNQKPELEYFMTADQIKTWLPTCSLDQLLDALDFAPEGVLTLIKKYAVELPLNDMNKANAIKKKLKFDVIKAIELDKTSKEEDKVPLEEKKERRVVLNDSNGQPTRRVTITPTENK